MLHEESVITPLSNCHTCELNAFEFERSVPIDKHDWYVQYHVHTRLQRTHIPISWFPYSKTPSLYSENTSTSPTFSSSSSPMMFVECGIGLIREPDQSILNYEKRFSMGAIDLRRVCVLGAWYCIGIVCVHDVSPRMHVSFLVLVFVCILFISVYCIVSIGDGGEDGSCGN